MPRSSPAIPGGTGNMPPAPSSLPGLPTSFPSGNTVSLGEMSSLNLAGGFGVRWTGLLEMQNKVNSLNEAVDNMRRQIADQLAVAMEAWAKANAPWQDQTGDARAGLTGYAVHDDEHHRSRAVIAHTVDYWFALEVVNGAEYGILLPTIQHFAAQALQFAGKMQ